MCVYPYVRVCMGRNLQYLISLFFLCHVKSSKLSFQVFCILSNGIVILHVFLHAN